MTTGNVCMQAVDTEEEERHIQLFENRYQTAVDNAVDKNDDQQEDVQESPDKNC